MNAHRAVGEYLCLYAFSNDELMVITSFLLSFLSLTTTLQHVPAMCEIAHFFTLNHIVHSFKSFG